MQMTEMIVCQHKLAQLQNHQQRHAPDHPVPWHPFEDDLLKQHRVCVSRQAAITSVAISTVTALGSPVQYLASHYIDAERCSLVFSFLQ